MQKVKETPAKAAAVEALTRDLQEKWVPPLCHHQVTLSAEPAMKTEDNVCAHCECQDQHASDWTGCSTDQARYREGTGHPAPGYHAPC